MNEDLNRKLAYADGDDNDEYYQNADEYADKEFIEDGLLDSDTIAKYLTNLGRSADGTKYLCLNLKVDGMNISDIKQLVNFKELQNLDLSNNQLSDLSPLSALSYLLVLNVSRNKIEKLFDFFPPYNLKEANFSYNHIKEIGNLVNFHYLQTLVLENNKIERIEGLEYCHRLRTLNLGHNLIKKIEGLDKLPIVNLDLRSNQIRKIENLNGLRFLRHLNLAGNMIKSLQGIPERHDYLEVIDLEDNKLSDLKEIDCLLHLYLLRDLNFNRNQIRDLNDYRLYIVFKLPQLTILDKMKVDAAEKVNANSLFNPSVEYIAARDHMTNLVFSFIQDHRVKESTLPNVDSPYPILILCGPEGCGRMEISRKLVEDYPDYFDFVVSHTTRDTRKNEKNKVDYQFTKLEQFEQDVTHGKFICCNEYLGDWYGIQSDTIESISKQGLACVIQTELEGLLSFKQTYFEPRCILLITLDKNIQIERLKNEDCSEDECEIAVSRTEQYSQYNQNHPGFFDAVIVTDDMSDGYENLRNLVMTYLGLGLGQGSTKTDGRPKTSEDGQKLEDTFSKDLELQRSDSFLPSKSVTANYSQQSSHQSIESLSQIYNTNLRIKFGSAPAQLLTQGFVAERSLEKRSSLIRKEFDDSNNVSVRSQLSQKISKGGERSMEPMFSSKSKSADVNTANSKHNKNKVKQTKINEEADSSDSSDDDNHKIENSLADL